MPADLAAQIEKLRRAIAALEDSDDPADADTLDRKRQQLNSLVVQVEQSGGVNITGNPQAQDIVGRNKTTTSTTTGNDNVTVQGNGNTIILNPTVAQPTGKTSAADALPRYLAYILTTHQHLRLQGIRAGSQPISVDLEKVYISLTALEKHGAGRQDKTSEGKPPSDALTTAEALRRYRRLVIIGDPGSGKTTLLSYLALTYAHGANEVRARLGLTEPRALPIFLPLRDLGRHLQSVYPNTALDGPKLLLDYLRAYYAAQQLPTPEDFFAAPLAAARGVVLLDGMDEVADPALRQRVARLIEKFAARYPGNRFVVTSRIVGYEGAARLGADFGLAEVRPFNTAEVRQFVRDWTRVVEVKLAGYETPEILRQAEASAGCLIQAIENNPRVSDLAVNPLLLTVIALVHRYRAQLPERRSELYEEAVEVLLGQWDEAKGLENSARIGGRALDAGDRRSLLEPVALWLHERARREIDRDELCPLLLPSFLGLTQGDKAQAAKATDAFLRLISERSGLLVERGIGVYGFAHLTFQEYLAARALADRDDALAYTLGKLTDPWWREAILLETGYLSTQGRRRVSELIRTIMNTSCPEPEPEPCYQLLLAVECLADAGAARVESSLPGDLKARLMQVAGVSLEMLKNNRPGILRKVAAMNALSRLEGAGDLALGGKFWGAPWGEPEWVTVPAGEFWIGSEKDEEHEKPPHRLYLPEFQISRTPVTNAQYALYIRNAGVMPPEHWRGFQPPLGKESHPVVYVSWHDALAYSRWLSEKLDKPVSLPSEAEWEKAARGNQDQRQYPWGKDWDDLYCNSSLLGLDDTSPVALFIKGASPYGCLDMSGNVWEWTRSIFKSYPYDPRDGRENLGAPNTMLRVLRGGSFNDVAKDARSAYRFRNVAVGRGRNIGFRLVLSPCR